MRRVPAGGSYEEEAPHLRVVLGWRCAQPAVCRTNDLEEQGSGLPGGVRIAGHFNAIGAEGHGMPDLK